MSAGLRLADALPDFGARLARFAPAVEPVAAALAFKDPDAELHDAVARAEATLAARLAEEHAAALADQAERHAAECAAITASLGNEAAARIAAAVGEAERRLTEYTLAAAARALSHLMGEALKDRSIEALGAVIRRALRDDEALRIEVSGPRSLYEPIAAALGARAEQLEFRESAGFDITIAVGEQLYESRLGEWSAVVEETLS